LSDASSPLLLDFRDGQVSELMLNSAPIPATIDHGHLVLPASNLHSGKNALYAKFTANIGAAGKAITRFEDHDDGQEYLYTLFVPMDASMAFPCFDQPDLKGRFTLELEHPAGWTAIGNTAPETLDATKTRFSETRPISTYLFAFAAGPFAAIPAKQSGWPTIFVRKSQLKRAQQEA